MRDDWSTFASPFLFEKVEKTVTKKKTAKKKKTLSLWMLLPLGASTRPRLAGSNVAAACATWNRGSVALSGSLATRGAKAKSKASSLPALVVGVGDALRRRPSTSSSSTSSLRAAAAASSSASSSPSPGDDNISSISSEPQKKKKNFFAAPYSSLSRSNDALPFAVVFSALLALLHPQFFAFFEPRHYPLALGFLSFSIGLSLDPSSFGTAISRDRGRSFAAGVFLQWFVKPLVGILVAKTVVPALRLPSAVGTGVVLCSIVSGAQLSNYATFLASPEFAPLSVLLTSTSTALGSVMTPLLALLLLRARLPPFDPRAVASSLAQVVILPIAAGISARRVLPSRVTAAARPALSALALLDTCCWVGSSLASNARFLTGGGGSEGGGSTAALVLVAVLSFHGLCAMAGSGVAASVVSRGGGGGGGGGGSSGRSEEERKGLGRCLALQGGMQSSLLALLLALSCFGGDLLVSAAAGISTAAMTIFGFMLVVFWKWRDGKELRRSSL